MSHRLGYNVRLWAVLTVLSVLLLQDLLSSNVSIGRLLFPYNAFFSELMLNQIWSAVKLAVFVPAVLFWLLDRSVLLRGSMILSNALLTTELFASTVLLVLHLRAVTAAEGNLLIQDTTLVILINLLIFSLWYWIIDHPSIKKDGQGRHESWDFLFPQRANSIPGYEDWIPRYMDYLFLAFTTTFTFGPADTLPLSGRAKGLMILQSTISVVNIVVLAGYSLNLINLS
ncbi:MAG TPA: hypothetical protein VN455_11690 [Methanotrichaceae archaeon]|nr:hypothetical protein [Methanotrichaceae archaeon]